VRSGDPLPFALIATLAQTLLEPPPLDGCQPLHHLLQLPFDGTLDGVAPEATGVHIGFYTLAYAVYAVLGGIMR
jgi:hypothetical protein